MTISIGFLEVTSQQFRDRFTEAETESILVLAQTDINVSLLLFKLQTTSEYLNLENQTLINGIDYLVSKGLLTRNKANAILN